MSHLSEMTAAGMEAVFALAGEPLDYRLPSANRRLSVEGVPGSTRAEAGGSGLIVNVRFRDFLLRASELVLEGAAFRPEKGHVIARPEVGSIAVYEVLPIVGDEVYRPLDPGGEFLRVHTVQRDTEPAT